jgi:hypothetical protein
MRLGLAPPFGWLVLAVMSEEHPPEPPEEEPQRGSMRFQDPETTRPREPTLAEARARRDREAARQQAREEAERASATRRKLFIGSGVTVGLVGVIAAWYLIGTANEVEAVCTDNTGVVVQDNYCDENYVTSQHGYYNSATGFWILPLVTGGFRQYRYNYGGTGTVGTRVMGGTYSAPSSHTTVKTKTGSVVQRGGFGVSTGGKSGGS